MDTTLAKGKVEGILNALETRERKGSMPAVMLSFAVFIGLVTLTFAVSSTSKLTVRPFLRRFSRNGAKPGVER